MALNVARMKTRTAQLTAAIGIAIALALIASPYVFAATTATSTPTTTTTSTSSNNVYTNCQGMGAGRFGAPGFGQFGFGAQSAPSLSVGQTITMASTQGEYYVVGSSNTNGTASGTITFTVTAKLTEGYTLSISSGSIAIGSTTYTISSGSAQMGRSASQITGQGTTSGSGQFLLRGSARGSFAGTTGQLSIDFQAGSTEYAVALVGTVQS